MSLFCFLSLPLFCAYRRSIRPGRTTRTGLALAFLAGAAFALLSSVAGDVVAPWALGAGLWLHSLVDRILLPAFVPLGASYLYRTTRAAAGTESGDLSLAWLSSFAAIKAISWSASADPVDLMLTPALWAAVAAGFPWLVERVRDEYGIASFSATAAAVALPFAAATALWLAQAVPAPWYLLPAALCCVPAGAGIAGTLAARLAAPASGTAVP